MPVIPYKQVGTGAAKGCDSCAMTPKHLNVPQINRFFENRYEYHDWIWKVHTWKAQWFTTLWKTWLYTCSEHFVRPSLVKTQIVCKMINSVFIHVLDGIRSWMSDCLSSESSHRLKLSWPGLLLFSADNNVTWPQCSLKDYGSRRNISCAFQTVRGSTGSEDGQTVLPRA